MSQLLGASLVFNILLAVLVAYLIGTSPSGVSPPVAVTEGAVPPWPIFRVVVGLGDLLFSIARATNPPQVQMIGLATEYEKSGVTYAFSKLGLADYLKQKQMTCTELAKEAALYEEYLCRFMLASEKIGLVKKGGDGKWLTTGLGELLEADRPDSKKYFIQYLNEEPREAFYSLTTAIKEGKSGFMVKFGDEHFPWYEKNSPEGSKQFDKAMQGLTVDSGMAIIQEVDYSQSKMFCDIGGGNGANMAIVLKHYPKLKGKVVDLGYVVKQGKQMLENAGVLDRAGLVEADFFKSFPDEVKECDTYFMKHILHDWNDEQSITILKNMAATMNSGDQVVIAEQVLGFAGNEMEVAKHLMDMLMLSICPPGAKERSIPQYTELLEAAGLKFYKFLPTRSIYGVVIGIKP